MHRGGVASSHSHRPDAFKNTSRFGRYELAATRSPWISVSPMHAPPRQSESGRSPHRNRKPDGEVGSRQKVGKPGNNRAEKAPAPTRKEGRVVLGRFRGAGYGQSGWAIAGGSELGGLGASFLGRAPEDRAGAGSIMVRWRPRRCRCVLHMHDRAAALG